MVARTRLIGTLHVHCLSCFTLNLAYVEEFLQFVHRDKMCSLTTIYTFIHLILIAAYATSDLVHSQPVYEAGED